MEFKIIKKTIKSHGEVVHTMPCSEYKPFESFKPWDYNDPCQTCPNKGKGFCNCAIPAMRMVKYTTC